MAAADEEFGEVPASSAPPPPERPMEYMESVRFAFSHADWAKNLALLAVCGLIPFVGGIVQLGYSEEVVIALHRRRDEDDGGYPAFDFDRFGKYLQRGLWPFLATLVAGTVIGTASVIVGYGGIALSFLVGAAIGGGIGVLAGLLLGAIVLAVGLALTVATQCAMLPMILRASLAQDLAAAFDFAFVKDFFERTRKELVLTVLFSTAALLGYMAVGSLVFCVGGLFAMAAYLLASAHLQWQLYELYLARGGRPIAVKD